MLAGLGVLMTVCLSIDPQHKSSFLVQAAHTSMVQFKPQEQNTKFDGTGQQRQMVML